MYCADNDALALRASAVEIPSFQELSEEELDAMSTATFTLSGLFHWALATSTTEVVGDVGMRAYVVMIASVNYDSIVSSFNGHVCLDLQR